MLFYRRVMWAALLGATALSGCRTADRLAQVGNLPPLSHIQNPHASRTYQPVTMPMPEPEVPEKRMNSLWRSGSRTFFKDQRASRVGDILTVVVSASDSASVSNESKRDRDSKESLSIANFIGIEGNFNNINPKKLVEAQSKPSHQGKGSISRKEEVTAKVAATVIQILPNGNMVVSGRQEMRINYEVRDLHITGIVRSEDINSDNTITLDKIAEARVSYGGRGTLDDVQQPPYGMQILDAVSPL